MEIQLPSNNEENNLENKNETQTKTVRWIDLFGLIRTVSAVPTWTPRKISEQIAIYKSGATIRLYVYDADNGAWRYTALT